MFVKGKVKLVPMKQFSIITEPFARVAVDIVRPLFSPTSEVHFSDTQKCVENDEDMPVTPDGRVDTETAQNFSGVSNNLTPAQKCDLQCALSEYEDVLSEFPFNTQSIKHDIDQPKGLKLNVILLPFTQSFSLNRNWNNSLPRALSDQLRCPTAHQSSWLRSLREVSLLQWTLEC